MQRRNRDRILRGLRNPRRSFDRLLVRWATQRSGELIAANLRATASMERRLGWVADELFDEDWYLSTYPAARDSGLAPIDHYREHGWRAGYDPHPDFDTDWYLDRYPDAAAAGIEPRAHFLLTSGLESHDPNPLFSTEWYLTTYPDVVETGLNPLLHYLHHGRSEGRPPRPIDRWLAREPSVAPDRTWPEPPVTIVIPVHGQWAYTERCLHALAASEARDLARTIVIDDRSPDDSLRHLKRFPWVEVIALPENLGYTRAVNRAARDVDTPFLLLLNNDTEPQPGFLHAMLDRMAREPSVGLVGSRLVYPDGSLQEAGSIIWSDASGYNYGREQRADAHPYTFSRDVDYCSAAAVLVRTPLWHQLGGYDERYSPAYYEDADLAFALRQIGARVVYEPSAVVVHHEGRSHGTDTSQGLKRHQLVNQQVFQKKWEHVLLNHARFGEFPQAVSSVHGRPRIILVVSEHLIDPDRDAGSVRMCEIFGIWRTQGMRVAVLTPGHDPQSPAALSLRRSGVEFITTGEEASAFLTTNRDWVAAVWYSHASTAFRWGPRIRQAVGPIPEVLDTVDLHHLREAAQAQLHGSTLGALRARSSKMQEFWAMENTTATVVVSETEYDYIRRTAPGVPVHRVSIIHRPQPDGPPFQERAGLLFVGSFPHPPNLDGVSWFLDEVWPLLPPGIRADGLDVVGGPRPAEIEARREEGVRVHGWVPELGPFLGGARLSIAPLRYGGGVKGKVGEAWACGLPVIGTSVAFDGMAAPGEYPRADTPEGLAALICAHYGDQQAWHELRRLGRVQVERHFSPEAAAQVLADLQRMLDKGRVIQADWRDRAEGRIRPWDLPDWPPSDGNAVAARRAARAPGPLSMRSRLLTGRRLGSS